VRTPAVHAQLRPDRASAPPAAMLTASWWRLPSAQPLPSAATKPWCLRVDHAEVGVICGVRTFFTGIKAARKRAAPRRCPALPLVLRSGPGGPAMSRWVAPKKIPGLGFRRPTRIDRHSSSLAAR